MAHGGDVAGLRGMARIALLDGDAQEQAGIAGLVRPGGGDVGHAGLHDVLPEQG